MAKFITVLVEAFILLTTLPSFATNRHFDSCLTLTPLSSVCRKNGLSLTFPNSGGTASRPYAKYLTTIPTNLRELTLCYWIKTHNTSSKTVFSYAVPKRPNEIWSGLHTQEAVFFHREVKTNSNNGAMGRIPKVALGVWQHLCTTWSSFDGNWQLFIQGEPVRGAQGTGFAVREPVEAGGIAVLGQDQDVFGGKFDDAKSFRGEITEVQLWDYVLRPGEIARLFNCTSNQEGNVFAWSAARLVTYNGVEMGPSFISCSN